jgi:hypothetical protein
MTWGSGSSVYTPLNSSSPAVDKFFINSSDRSYQRVAYKWVGTSPITPTPTPTPTSTVTPTNTITATVAPTVTPTNTVTPTLTPGYIASLDAWSYSYSNIPRNNFTGFVGNRFTTSDTFTNFYVTAIGFPYLTINGGSFSTTLHLLDSGGNSIDSTSITVAAGSQFAVTYVTFNAILSPSTNYYIMAATSFSGFYWNDVGGNTIASYNAVNPSSLVPVTDVTGAYSFSIPEIPSLFGGGASFVGLVIQGYTEGTPVSPTPTKTVTPTPTPTRTRPATATPTLSATPTVT